MLRRKEHSFMPTIYRKVITYLETGERVALDPVEMTQEQYLDYLSLYIDITAEDVIKRMKEKKAQEDGKEV